MTSKFDKLFHSIIKQDKLETFEQFAQNYEYQHQFDSIILPNTSYSVTMTARLNDQCNEFIGGNEIKQVEVYKKEGDRYNKIKTLNDERFQLDYPEDYDHFINVLYNEQPQNFINDIMSAYKEKYQEDQDQSQTQINLDYQMKLVKEQNQNPYTWDKCFFDVFPEGQYMSDENKNFIFNFTQPYVDKNTGKLVKRTFRLNQAGVDAYGGSTSIRWVFDGGPAQFPVSKYDPFKRETNNIIQGVDTLIAIGYQSDGHRFKKYSDRNQNLYIKKDKNGFKLF